MNDEQTSAESTTATDEFERALDAIDDGEYHAAALIAESLYIVQHSGAFEIDARVAIALDDIERACETLERGVEAAPDAWRLWQLLGNVRSDLDRFDAAAESYERATRCPEVWLPSVRFNRAVLEARRGNHGRALEMLVGLGEVSDESLRMAAIDLELECRRVIRDEVLDRGSIYEILVDSRDVNDDAPPAEDGSPAIGWVQRLHAAAASIERVRELILEDLGPRYHDTEVTEANEIQDASGFLAGVYWVAPRRFYYVRAGGGGEN